MSTNHPYRTRILSIDGGGVRGVIPAVILKYLEEKLQNLSNNPDARIAHYFDLFAGTSTGALIVAGLLVPDKDNKPRYSAQQMVELYKNTAHIIFNASLLQSIKSVSGILDVKYNAEGFEGVLDANFGNCELKDLLKPCLIPAYDLQHSKNYYFRQYLAHKNPEHNYYIRDVLRATSAAPTYFSPAQILAVEGKYEHCFIDGGIFAINPAPSAYAEYRNLNPSHHAKDTMMLSLGTGRKSLQVDCEKLQHLGAMEWRDIASNIIATATPEASHEQLQAVYNRSSYYLRLNADFDPLHSCSLDNSDKAYLAYLVELGGQVVKKNQNALDKFAQQLIDNNPKSSQYQQTRLTYYLDNAAQYAPKNVALIGFDTPINYTQLRHHSLALCAYLSKHTEPGVVAIMLPNLLSFPVSLFAVWYSNRTATLVNPLVSSDELLKQCLDSGAKTIIVAQLFLKTLQNIIAKTAIKNVITVEIGDLQPKLKRHLLNGVSFIKHPNLARNIDNVDSVCLDKILKNKTPINANIQLDNDIALLQYTGGTSGTLKAAVLTHQNIDANIKQVQHWLDDKITSSSMILTALPLYHIFAMSVNLLLFIHLKASSVLVANPRQIKQLIHPLEKYPIEVITGVNTLFSVLVRYPKFSKLDHSNLKFVIGGGMAVNEGVAKLWQQQTGKPITQGYGLSECSPVVSVDANDISDFTGSVGKALIDTQIKILDPQSKECAFNKVGEIVIKGPQVMESYWKKPELNQQVFTEDGFFRSGDLGYLDNKGRLFIVDRLKEMMIVSGFNVYPNEVEKVLNQHPEVIESACVGMNDEQGNQHVKAFVVKKQNTDLSAKQLIAYCQEHLSHYKIPKAIEWIDNLPKTPVGKVLKRKLKT